MQKVKKVEYSFPEGFDEQGKDLVQKLLVGLLYFVALNLSNRAKVREPQQRLGAGMEGADNDMKGTLLPIPSSLPSAGKTLWTDPTPSLESGSRQEGTPAFSR